MFCNGFLDLIPSTPLNWSLWNFNRWCVSVGSRKLWGDFWVLAPKNGDPKTT